MSDPVLVALIGLIGSGIGAFGGILISTKLMQYRLEQLEKTVETFSKVVERVYKIEERIELQEEKIRVMSNRVSDLAKDSG